MLTIIFISPLIIFGLVALSEYSAKKKMIAQTIEKIRFINQILPQMIEVQVHAKKMVEDLRSTISTLTNSSAQAEHILELRRLEAEESKLDFIVNMLLKMSGENIGVLTFVEYESELVCTIGCDITELPKKYGLIEQGGNYYYD